MKPLKLPLACLLLLLLTAAVWGQAETVLPPAVAETDPTTAEEMSMRMARIPVDLPGWAIIEPALTCDVACVAEHVPEDAALVKSYDFVWSLTMRLLPAEPKQEIVAHIYRMGDALDAFGIFSRHQGEHTKPAQILTESVWAGHEFHLWRGAFYIRVTPTTGDQLLKGAVMAAAEAIAAKIPIPERLPLMMRLMPQGRHRPGTLRYYQQTLLGQTELGPGLVDTYLENGETLSFVLLRAEDETAAAWLYDRIRSTLSGGDPVTPLPDLGKAAATTSSSQYGLSYLMREGRYVAMAINVHDRPTAEGLLRITGTNIRITRE
ncbi:MAG: DUF6599 family protein [Armatimonadota bacterium]